MSVLEERYRSLLRLLPASYRAMREEEMVVAFLDSIQTEDADYADYLRRFRPPQLVRGGQSRGSVRVRLGGVSAPPRSLAWGEAVRRVALIGLLFTAAEVWSLLLISALPLLALAAFHQDAPPVPRRPWLVALGAGITLTIPLAFLMPPPPMDQPDLRMVLLDPPGAWSVALVAAGVVHVTGLTLGWTPLAATWALALALLAPAVLAARVLTLLQLRLHTPASGRFRDRCRRRGSHRGPSGGRIAVVLAAQALRRLTTAPAEQAASYMSTR